MTYATFLLAFVAPPVAAMAWYWRRSFNAVLPLLVIVYAAATPWDNFAAASGLWTFDPAKISGVRLWHLPLEEYVFFGLQTLLTGLWTARRMAEAR